MKPAAPERFAMKTVAALILAMTAQALPLSYLIEFERAKIEPAAKLFQQECDDNTESRACKEQRDVWVKVLNGFVSMARNELALLDATLVTLISRSKLRRAGYECSRTFSGRWSS